MAKKPQVRFRQCAKPEQGALLAAGYIDDDSADDEDCRDRRLEDFALVYLLAGGGEYEDELNGRREVAQGDVILVFPGLRHGYRRGPGKRWHECFAVFQGGIFHQLERDGLISRQATVLSPGLDPALMAGFDAVIRDHLQSRAGSDPWFAARIHLLLMEILERHRRAEDRGAGRNVIGQARALLEERLDERLDLDRLARSLGFSYENFRKLFSREIGVPPARYRLLRRIDEAKNLLVGSALSITDIAERLGYCDAYFFCRQFKQVTKQTPGGFRALFLNRAEG
ncbi:MAG: helix-turn-helix transcriptional regulator [Chthoniobacterales bacterium]|nr:helix-turn-helix transcriptional regulator [Chthoniobacterales bacterium]